MYSRLFETSHPNAATGSPWAQSTESGSMSWFLCSSVDLSAGYDAAVHHHVRTMMLPSENIVTVTTGCIDWNFSFCNVCFPESFSYCIFYEWLRHDLIGSESQQEETAGTAADAAWAGFAYMPSWIWIWAVWHCDEWSLRSALVTSMLFPPSLILKNSNSQHEIRNSSTLLTVLCHTVYFYFQVQLSHISDGLCQNLWPSWMFWCYKSGTAH